MTIVKRATTVEELVEEFAQQARGEKDSHDLTIDTLKNHLRTLPLRI